MVLRHSRKNYTNLCRVGHKTKNFLPAFKKCHENYLEENLPFEMLQNESYKKIMSKTSISLEDYETIYNIKEFKDTLIKFFRNRVMYRNLMLSRISGENRRTYMRYIKRFEEAFILKEFTHIV